MTDAGICRRQTNRIRPHTGVPALTYFAYLGVGVFCPRLNDRRHTCQLRRWQWMPADRQGPAQQYVDVAPGCRVRSGKRRRGGRLRSCQTPGMARSWTMRGANLLTDSGCVRSGPGAKHTAAPRVPPGFAGDARRQIQRRRNKIHPGRALQTGEEVPRPTAQGESGARARDVRSFDSRGGNRRRRPLRKSRRTGIYRADFARA